jgi:2-polyprenyl-3-methyl-5-hydroxy-6-metoxy-1,4-benzoquinol methylase
MQKKYITQKREPFFQIAKDLINDNSKVLDIGAGDCSFSKYCNRKDFFMIDGNNNTVETFKNEYKNYFYSQLPIIPFNNHHFDIIHCSHVIEHLDPQCLYSTLKEIDRCLKPSGYLIISAPLLTDFFYDDLSHFKPYNPNIFIKYLTDVKLNNLSREKIADYYTLHNITYRYKAYHLIDGEVILPLKLLNKLLFKIGLIKYKKTGYTIALKKLNKE